MRSSKLKPITFTFRTTLSVEETEESLRLSIQDEKSVIVSLGVISVLGYVGDKLVCFCQIVPDELSNTQVLNLFSLRTHPDYQKRGYARKILEAIKEYFQTLANRNSRSYFLCGDFTKISIISARRAWCKELIVYHNPELKTFVGSILFHQYSCKFFKFLAIVVKPKT